MDNGEGFYKFDSFEEELKNYQKNHPTPSYKNVLDFSNSLNAVIGDYKEMRNALSFIYHLILRLNTDEIDINSLDYFFNFKDHELKNIVENTIEHIIELKRKCHDKP